MDKWKDTMWVALWDKLSAVLWVASLGLKKADKKDMNLVNWMVDGLVDM